MPVTALYCEGNYKSIDNRVIRQLLPECDIRPLGGKTPNLLSSIIADRRRNPNLACLVDRDFDCRNFNLYEAPVRYTYDGVWVGWSWERKEIENYLIDPAVVQRALGNKAPARDDYQNALDRAAETIATYSATRTALACEQFKNFWGEAVRQGHYFPQKLGKKACQVKIDEIVREYGKDRLISKEDVLDKFNTLRSECQPGGSRFKSYLYYFAGKDLLYAMRHDLIKFEFEPPTNSEYSPEEFFLEKIVSRLERLDRVWEWLPEWMMLRRLIEETDFSAS